MFMQATATEHASLLGGGSKRYGAVAPPRSKIQQNGRRVGAALIVVCMVGVLALLTDHRPRTGDAALDETETYAGVGTAVVTKEGGKDIIKLTLDLTLPPTHWNDNSSPICTAATTTAEDNCADRGGECYRNNATCVEGQGVFLPELCKVEGDGGDCGCCIKQPSMAPTAPTPKVRRERGRFYGQPVVVAAAGQPLVGGRRWTLAESLNVGDFVALETGDYWRPQREGGGSTHAFLLARVMEQRGSGGKGYVVADDRATRTHDNEEYRPGDPVVLVRLFDRTGADTRRFTVRIYRANGRSVLRKLDSGDGREDQPVVGGTTAVAPRATYTITSAAERAITTAAAH
ncbi:hypothetical protein JL721_9513 [Aureococcus anophagefferens]|nr:hypothetical protein JL721_9513 [Aureococcus anophagefferens]